MRLSVDPQPYGAFIEYTLKPLIDDTRELVEIFDKNNLDLKSMMHIAVWLYLIDKVLSFLINISVTGIICWTVYLILSHSPLLTQ